MGQDSHAKKTLESLFRNSVDILWHENRSTYLSVKRRLGRLEVRVHKLFQTAPTPVLEAVVRFVEGKDPGAKTVIRQMVQLYFKEQKIEPRALEPKGKVYDLAEIFERINREFGLKGVSIGWGVRGGIGRFRSMTFGSYDGRCRQIRINPLLDNEEVPLYFVEFIVYHELLHDVFGSKMKGGRCSVHTKEFRDKERCFAQFQEAKEWEKNSLMFFKKRQRHGRA